MKTFVVEVRSSKDDGFVPFGAWDQYIVTKSSIRSAISAGVGLWRKEKPRGRVRTLVVKATLVGSKKGD